MEDTNAMRLAGRRILVTGAGSGIGAATAMLFGKEGARLALLDQRLGDVAAVARALEGSLAYECDVARADEVSGTVAQAISALGGLDGVVNVAGIDLLREFAAMTTSEWQKVLDVNLTGPMHVCRAALPALRASGRGTIVNIASAAGLRPLANRTAYCASKAGLVMFTKALALELAALEIRANVVCPGVIDTPMLRASYESAKDPQAAFREIISRPAMGRVGTADDIAQAALYLSGEESLYTTGSTLTVDGGRAFH